MAGARGGDDVEAAAEGVAILNRVHVLRDLEVIDEARVEAAVFASCEDVGERLCGGLPGGVERRREPREVEARQLHAVLEHEPRLAREMRRDDGLRRRLRPARDRPVIVLDETPRLGKVDVARHDETRVVGRVVGPEERGDVVVAGRREVRHGADDGPVVRVPGGVERLAEDREGHPVRPVLVRLPALVLDHVALAVDALGRHRAEQRRHPVCVEEEGEREPVRRRVGRVVGPVMRRGAVGAAARLLEPRVDGALRDVPGALEHEVLEEVREAGPARRLAGTTHVVPRVDADGRDRGVPVEHDVEPVGELEPLELDGERRADVLRRGGSGQDGEGSCQPRGAEEDGGHEGGAGAQRI